MLHYFLCSKSVRIIKSALIFYQIILFHLVNTKQEIFYFTVKNIMSDSTSCIWWKGLYFASCLCNVEMWLHVPVDMSKNISLHVHTNLEICSYIRLLIDSVKGGNSTMAIHSIKQCTAEWRYVRMTFQLEIFFAYKIPHSKLVWYKTNT